MYGVAPRLYPPPRRGAGQQLIYLDFDGPLHHHDVRWSKKRGPFLPDHLGRRLFEHAPLLEALLQDHAEVRIVLSTSWVFAFGYSKAVKKLPAGLRERVIGATFHQGMYQPDFERAERGAQVWEDVCRRQPSAWLALDDDARAWPDACRHNLIEVDGATGLGNPDVAAELTRRLASWRINSTNVLEGGLP